MRLPRLGIFLAALFLAPLAARAEDTKPPVISDVKATQKGGKVSIEAKITDETGVLSAICSHRKMGSSKFEDTAMVKNEFDDNFKVSFSGGADTEYYISTTDLLGNGPATYGTAAKAMTLGGKPSAVASAEPPAHHEEPPPVHHDEPVAQEHHTEHHHTAAPKTDDTPPTIAHHKPTAALPEGQDFKLRFHITAPAGFKKAIVFARPQGYQPAAGAQQFTVQYPIVPSSSGGDSYEVTIPGDVAHGTLEYFLMAEDNNNARTAQGDPDPAHWFAITFKGGGETGGGASQVLVISQNTPSKWAPGQPVHIRAQATLPNVSAEMSDQEAADMETKMGTVTAKLISRTQDVGDAITDMTSDPSGGLAGFSADLPAQQDGNPVYYQVVMCLADKCAIDTGSKHKWNSFTVTGGDPQVPTPIKAVSSKAPAGLPD